MNRLTSYRTAVLSNQVFASHHEHGAGRPRRVLIVDDDRNLSNLVSTLLRSYGLEVVTAPDGLSGLDALASNDVNAVVLDLRMPGMDGRSMFREMRARGFNVPVLVASAYGARAAQLELGAQASIEKPFDPETLAEAVLKLLETSSL